MLYQKHQNATYFTILLMSTLFVMTSLYTYRKICHWPNLHKNWWICYTIMPILKKISIFFIQRKTHSILFFVKVLAHIFSLSRNIKQKPARAGPPGFPPPVRLGFSLDLTLDKKKQTFHFKKSSQVTEDSFLSFRKYTHWLHYSNV